MASVQCMTVSACRPAMLCGLPSALQGFNLQAQGPWFWIEGLMELFFCVDLVLNFFTAYEVGCGPRHGRAQDSRQAAFFCLSCSLYLAVYCLQSQRHGCASGLHPLKSISWVPVSPMHFLSPPSHTRSNFLCLYSTHCPLHSPLSLYLPYGPTLPAPCTILCRALPPVIWSQITIASQSATYRAGSGSTCWPPSPLTSLSRDWR